MIENYRIRTALASDLEAIVQLEACCFPESEAAGRDDFSERIRVFGKHFYLLETDGKIVSIVNGMVSNLSNLTDEMYHNTDLHDENGKWQMIFGVETHPEYKGRGYAGILLRYAIETAEKEKRKGLVLTCKKELIPFYEKFGFVNEGLSDSAHGNAVWYQMRKTIFS